MAQPAVQPPAQPPAAPGTVGYLAQSSPEAAAGTVPGGSGGAMLAVVSPSGSGSAFRTDAVQVAAGGTTLSSGRRSTALAAAPMSRPELFPAGPQNLRASLVPAPGTASKAPALRAAAATLGDTKTFWVQQGPLGGTASDMRRTATLSIQTAHADVWIDDTLAIPAQDDAAIAADVENAAGSDAEHFGAYGYAASSPGMQPSFQTCDASGRQTGSAPAYIVPPADGRFDVLIVDVAALGGTGGYFNGADLMTQAALNCLNAGGAAYESNEMPLVVVGWSAALGSDYELREDLVRSSAHELQHMINFVHHAILPQGAASPSYSATESPYINEGLSMLAQDLAVARMYGSSGVAHDGDALQRVGVFLAAPQNYSIRAFSGVDPGAASASYNCAEGCYGGAMLLQRYLYDRFGGDAYAHAMESGAVGTANLQAATGESASQLLGDFALALAAANGGTGTPGSAFGSGTLAPGGQYRDQFGGSTVLPALGSAPASAGVVATPAGGMAFVALPGAPPSGVAVSVSATAQLLAGYAEQDAAGK